MPFGRRIAVMQYHKAIFFNKIKCIDDIPVYLVCQVKTIYKNDIKFKFRT